MAQKEIFLRTKQASKINNTIFGGKKRKKKTNIPTPLKS